jgi:hypothetical protein
MDGWTDRQVVYIQHEAKNVMTSHGLPVIGEKYLRRRLPLYRVFRSVFRWTERVSDTIICNWLFLMTLTIIYTRSRSVVKLPITQERAVFFCFYKSSLICLHSPVSSPILSSIGGGGGVHGREWSQLHFISSHITRNEILFRTYVMLFAFTKFVHLRGFLRHGPPLAVPSRCTGKHVGGYFVCVLRTGTCKGGQMTGVIAVGCDEED